VVEVFENDRKKNLIKCASVSIDRAENYEIKVQVRHHLASTLPGKGSLTLAGSW
jgi:hypothetical protein